MNAAADSGFIFEERFPLMSVSFELVDSNLQVTLPFGLGRTLYQLLGLITRAPFYELLRCMFRFAIV